MYVPKTEYLNIFKVYNKTFDNKSQKNFTITRLYKAKLNVLIKTLENVVYLKILNKKLVFKKYTKCYFQLTLSTGT